MIPNISFMTLTEGGNASPFEGIGTALSSVWSWFSSMISTANSYPIIWIGLAFGIAGATVGLLRRATRVGGRRR